MGYEKIWAEMERENGEGIGMKLVRPGNFGLERCPAVTILHRLRKASCMMACFGSGSLFGYLHIKSGRKHGNGCTLYMAPCVNPNFSKSNDCITATIATNQTGNVHAGPVFSFEGSELSSQEVT